MRCCCVSGLLSGLLSGLPYLCSGLYTAGANFCAAAVVQFPSRANRTRTVLAAWRSNVSGFGRQTTSGGLGAAGEEARRDAENFPTRPGHSFLGLGVRSEGGRHLTQRNRGFDNRQPSRQTPDYQLQACRRNPSSRRAESTESDGALASTGAGNAAVPSPAIPGHLPGP